MASDVASPTDRQTAELTEAEMRAALALAGLEPSRNSALRQTGAENIQPESECPGEAIRKSLVEKGILEASGAPRPTLAWRQTLAVLAMPQWDLGMVVRSTGELHYDRYFAAPQGPHLIFHRRNISRGTHDVAFPYGLEDVIRAFDAALGLHTPAAPSHVHVTLSFPEYVVLTGVIDVIRQRNLESLLARRPLERTGVAVNEIRDLLETGLASQETRWLVPLGNAVSPLAFECDLSGLEAVLEALQQHEVLVGTADGAGRLPACWVAEMAESLQLMPGFAAVEVTSARVGEVVESCYFTAIRGVDALWLVEFLDVTTNTPRVAITTVSGDTLRTRLHGLLGWPGPAGSAGPGHLPAPPSTPAPAAYTPIEIHCPHCRRLAILGKRFCRHCGQALPLSAAVGTTAAGAPLDAQPAVGGGYSALDVGSAGVPLALPASCPVCGLVLPASARFCGRCGATTDTGRSATVGTPPNKPPCPSCHRSLALNARFCAFCGQRVTREPV